MITRTQAWAVAIVMSAVSYVLLYLRAMPFVGSLPTTMNNVVLAVGFGLVSILFADALLDLGYDIRQWRKQH